MELLIVAFAGNALVEQVAIDVQRPDNLLDERDLAG